MDVKGKICSKSGDVLELAAQRGCGCLVLVVFKARWMGPWAAWCNKYGGWWPFLWQGGMKTGDV